MPFQFHISLCENHSKDTYFNCNGSDSCFYVYFFIADKDGRRKVIISSRAGVNIILTSKVEINSTFYVSTIVPLNFFNYTNFNDSFIKIITGNCYRVLTEQQLWYCFIDKNTHYAKVCAMDSVIKKTKCTNARNGVESVNISFTIALSFHCIFTYKFHSLFKNLIRSLLAKSVLNLVFHYI